MVCQINTCILQLTCSIFVCQIKVHCGFCYMILGYSDNMIQHDVYSKCSFFCCILTLVSFSILTHSCPTVCHYTVVLMFVRIDRFCCSIQHIVVPMFVSIDQFQCLIQHIVVPKFVRLDLQKQIDVCWNKQVPRLNQHIDVPMSVGIDRFQCLNQYIVVHVPMFFRIDRIQLLNLTHSCGSVCWEIDSVFNSTPN